MKISSSMSFKLIALASAMMVSTAFAASYEACNSACTQYAQNGYASAQSYYTTQQTNYCNGLADPNARSACLAGVPAYAEQQAQGVYTYVYNECMRSCRASP
jgi:hypothetical protein